MDKILIISLIFVGFLAKAEYTKKETPESTSKLQFRAAECTAPTSRIDLDINNVRTTILNGGDMWWDLDNAKYEVPKGSGKHSVFAGSIMIGGKDETGNLKMAALTHRDGGSDFWPGPINKDNASTTPDVCEEYDKHFKINRKEVEDYITSFKAGENPLIPTSMMKYPAHGSIGDGHDYYLAPFYDADSNGTYNPENGDYPAFDLGDNNMRYANGKLQGDQNIWWVFNDVGNIHTESGGNAIGLEIQAQAFGFATNDAINNMTFYNYKIINRSTFTIQDCYMGIWADTDLGYAFDDFVGCDVERGLGYCYNGDAYDENSEGYGANPPAIGIDFFEGPKADVGDGIDNDRDGIIDEDGELITMSKFMYHNIGKGDQGDPITAIDFYNYARGRWKNGAPMRYGGSGFSAIGTACDFMFPDDSDQNKHWGTAGAIVAPWSEITAGNAPYDRRFLQSAGPFTLEPGAVNFITAGVVWAQGDKGGSPWSAVQNLKKADDLAQALFDNDFNILNGPDAPDMQIQEMQNKLLFQITNSESSNNYKEQFSELDPTIIAPFGTAYDSIYSFQGYKVYQLENSTVSSSELDDISKARLVWQSDIEDNISKIVNHLYDEDIEFEVPQIMVDGKNNGIEHSFSITTDVFASGDKKLVNNKQYFYMAIAYAHNEYLPYSGGNDGQKSPYKAGRRNIKQYSVIPHDPSLEGRGTKVQALFGTSPEIKTISGTGNGGEFVNLSQNTIDEIMTSSSHKSDELIYTKTGSPIGIKVTDPMRVPNGDFRLEFMDTITEGDLSDAYWRLVFKPFGEQEYTDTIYSDRDISIKNEQIIKDWGLSVGIEQVMDVSESGANNFGFIGDSVLYEDNSLPWLTGVEDKEGESWQNWIRSGTDQTSTNSLGNFMDYHVFSSSKDTDGDFENVSNSWIAPFKYVSRENFGPAVKPAGPQNQNDITKLNNVDLVITADKNKWSICPVFELADDAPVSQFGEDKLNIKKGVTKDWNGNELDEGLGYFPGYAIDVLTGERLNIAFGEYSFYEGDNGSDMIWNPTSTMYDNMNQPIFGGIHSVYIFRNAEPVGIYDGGQGILNKYNSGSLGFETQVFKNCTWVFGYPISSDAYPFLATDVTFKLRVNEPYESTLGGLPIYSFNTADIYAIANDNATAKANLDKTNIVPNPYYGFSEYEMNKLSNEIKITNLPKECSVKVFTLDGTLVKTLNKDNDDITSISWDLKNEQGINIASGLYLFHVNAPGIGEKIIKWFGVQREIDLDSF